MPIGVIIEACAVAAGGLIGAVVGKMLTQNFKDNMNMIFGCCSMGMGISAIVLMENMPAVVFSLIIGTVIGLAIHFGELINKAAGAMEKLVSRFVTAPENGITDEEFNAQLVTIIVLFCASGTGIYGAIISGMTGDQSVLITKAILDLFTALIFACTLGAVVALVAVPQFVIFLVLFFLAVWIYPLTTPEMINDFKACGGFIMLATGFRIINVKTFPFPTADMVLSMILVMPMSWVWTSFILPLVS